MPIRAKDTAPRLRNRSGVTLFEAVAAMAIVGIVSVAALETAGSQMRTAERARRMVEASALAQQRLDWLDFMNETNLRALPDTVRTVLDEAVRSSDPTLEGDQRRLVELEAERREGLPDFADDIERYYSPARTWQSLAAGLAGLLELGDVLDVGSGDGAAASSLAFSSFS